MPPCQAGFVATSVSCLDLYGSLAIGWASAQSPAILDALADTASAVGGGRPSRALQHGLADRSSPRRSRCMRSASAGCANVGLRVGLEEVAQNPAAVQAVRRPVVSRGWWEMAEAA